MPRHGTAEGKIHQGEHRGIRRRREQEGMASPAAKPKICSPWPPCLRGESLQSIRLAGSAEAGAEGLEFLAALLTAIDLQYVLELAELEDDLLQAAILLDQQQDETAGAVVDREAGDALEVEGTAGEEAANMAHHAGMVADQEAQDGAVGSRSVIGG